MILRILIPAFLILIAPVTRAQSIPVHYFFCEKDQRGYHGNYSAFSVRIFADSTIELRVYVQPGVSYLTALQKVTHIGKFSRQNERYEVRYWTSYAEYREMPATGNITNRFEIKKAILPVMTPGLPSRFEMNNENLSMPGWPMPLLQRSSAIQVNAMETIFQKWGKIKQTAIVDW